MPALGTFLPFKSVGVRKLSLRDPRQLTKHRVLKIFIRKFKKLVFKKILTRSEKNHFCFYLIADKNRHHTKPSR